MTSYLSHSVAETEAFAARLAAHLRPGDVVAYRGGMGAGKTALTRGLAAGRGVRGEISSPTFAIVNEYRGPVNLYHFDMYRVLDIDDVETTGFFDYLERGDSILAVEWSENVEAILPPETITVTIEPEGEDCRRITVENLQIDKRRES